MDSQSRCGCGTGRTKVLGSRWQGPLRVSKWDFLLRSEYGFCTTRLDGPGIAGRADDTLILMRISSTQACVAVAVKASLKYDVFPKREVAVRAHDAGAL